MTHATLLFHPDGVELLDEHGKTLWASDSDQVFREIFGELVDEDDAEDVVDYLIEREDVVPRTVTEIDVETSE